MSDIPPHECYQHLGFTPFDGQGPSLEVGSWKALQESSRLQDIRQRYLYQRERAGQPLIDHGYIVGWVPELRLSQEEVDKLLRGLEEGLAAGCTTVTEWQNYKLKHRLSADSR